MYDVAIIGAGPAGSTLARLIGPRYRVLLVDRRQLDAPFRAGSLAKPCGGLLAPAAQAELARQGLGVPASVIAGPQLFAVRALDLVAKLERLYQRFYVNVDREAFDRWLVSLAPDCVETGFGWTLTALERDAEGPLLHFRTAEGGHASARTRLVIGADGASSLVRRLAFPTAATPRRYSAIQATFESGSSEAYYGAIFDSESTDFYGWVIPKAESVIVGAALEPETAVWATFDKLVERMRTAGIPLGAESGRESAMVLRPGNPWDLCPGADSVLLAGEAAGFISPSSAEGISYALRSAALLASALAPGLEGAGSRYRAAASGLALKIGVKAAKSSAIYATGARRLIMRSGIGSIPLHEGLSFRPTFYPTRQSS